MFWVPLFVFAGGTAQAQDVGYEKQIDLQVERQGDSFSLSSETVVKKHLLTARAAQGRVLSVISEPFYSEISNLYGTVDGRAIPSENIVEAQRRPQNVFMSGTRLHRIEVTDGVEKGATLTYGYRQSYDALAYAPIFRVPNVDQVWAYEVRFQHPKDVSVEFEAFVPGTSVDYDITRPSGTQTVLRVDTLEARPRRSYDPFQSVQAAFLPTISVDGSPRTPTTKPRFVEWYTGLLPEAESVHESPLVEDLMSGTDTALDSVRALYDFARQDVRYLADHDSINAIVPHPPRTVVDHRYGDCKDKAYFIAQTAQRMGLEVHMVLLNTSAPIPFEGEHVTHYNHVINAVRHDGEWIYFDPTHRYLPFGNLPASDRGRRMLLLDPASPRQVVARPHREETPLDISVTTTLDHPSRGTATITLRQDFFASALRAQKTKTPTAFENHLSTLVNGPLYRITLSRFQVADQGDRTMTLSARANLGDFVVASSTRRYVPKTPFQVVPSDILERRDDSAPLRRPHTPRMDLTLNLENSGFAADSSQVTYGDEAERQEGNVAAGVEAALIPDSSQTQVQYEYIPFPRPLQSSERSRYFDFAETYLGAKNQMFIFTSSNSNP